MIKKILLTILIAIISFIIGFFITAGIIKLISLCFDFAFTWKLALGIWLIMILLSSVFRGGSK